MNLDRIMKDKKITNIVIAKRFNTTTATVSRWRNGVNNPDPSILPELCDYLGCTLDELLRDDVNPTAPLPQTG